MTGLIEIKAIRGGGEEVSRKLRDTMRKISDTSRPNRQISIWLLRWVNENFKTQGGKVGGWKPFRHGGRRLEDGSIDASAKLLQDTGRLRGSFSNFYSKTSAGVGSGLRYAKAHELGLPHRRLPARRMVPIDTDRDVIDAAFKIYDTFVMRAIR